MTIPEAALSGDLQGHILRPEPSNGWGIVVLGGSSGRVDVPRARLLASEGAVTIALRWFGGAEQVPGICEVPLEGFTVATDRLVDEGCTRIAYVGTSKGAEAALLVATGDLRLDAVVAISPSAVVWANIGPGRDGAEWPQRSSWTRNGIPLPFVPYDVGAETTQRDGLVSYRVRHEQSMLTFAAAAAEARIPVENARAKIVLVAGGDDALWPSDTFARSMAAQLEAAGKKAVVISHPDAGHRVLLPGETTPRSSLHAHGGSDRADCELGKSAWDAIVEILHQPA
ncbi:MAG: acyl-CoA thioesterase [Hyphomicrobiaceae bacterium]|nr:acyl-CoA thioesterase [Hyphomicrobiaceae bacterium]